MHGLHRIILTAGEAGEKVGTSSLGIKIDHVCGLSIMTASAGFLSLFIEGFERQIGGGRPGLYNYTT